MSSVHSVPKINNKSVSAVYRSANDAIVSTPYIVRPNIKYNKVLLSVAPILGAMVGRAFKIVARQRSKETCSTCVHIPDNKNTFFIS